MARKNLRKRMEKESDGTEVFVDATRQDTLMPPEPERTTRNADTTRGEPNLPTRDIPDRSGERINRREERLGGIESLLRQLVVTRQDPSSQSSDPEVLNQRETHPRNSTPMPNLLAQYGPGDSQPQPVVINQISPEPYYGERSKARTWLRQYESVMRINGYNDDQKLLRATAYMKGVAESWHNVVLIRQPDIDWREYKKQFLANFSGAIGSAMLYERILRMTQREGGHASQFVMKLVDLCYQLDRNMSETIIISQIYRGLNTDVANLLVSSKPLSEWTVDWLTHQITTFKSRPNVRASTSQNQAQQGQPRASTRDQGQISAPSSQPTETAKKCYNCDGIGHIRRECP